MRTKTIGGLASVVVFCALLAALPLSAQEGSSTTQETTSERREAGREAIRDTIEERRAEIASSSAEFRQELETHKAALAERVQKRLYGLTSNIERRMEAAVERLTNITERMATRAAKLKAEGVATEEAEVHISAARTALSAAGGILADDLGMFAYSENPRAQFTDVRKKLREVHGHIKIARDELRAALAALKDPDGSSDAEENAATSTDEIVPILE